jgi:hypothetical protein
VIVSPAPAPANAKPEKIDIAVSAATVPGGELRIVLTLGEQSIALKLPDAMNLARLVLDCCQTVKDATFTRVDKATLQ